MMKKTALSLAMALSLAACGGDKAVDAVKNSPYNGERGAMTVGDIMDGRAMCKDQSWSSSEIPNSDDVRVEYRCVFSGAKEYFVKAGEERLALYDKKQGDRSFSFPEKERFESALESVEFWKKVVDDVELHPRVVAVRQKIADYESRLAEPGVSDRTKRSLRLRISQNMDLLAKNLENGKEHARHQLEIKERRLDLYEEIAEQEAVDHEKRLALFAQSRERLIETYDVQDEGEEFFYWKVSGEKIRPKGGNITVKKSTGEYVEWPYNFSGKNALDIIHDVEAGSDQPVNFPDAMDARTQNEPRSFMRAYLFM